MTTNSNGKISYDERDDTDNNSISDGDRTVVASSNDTLKTMMFFKF